VVQYGGGLVGRGHFDAPNKVTIKANPQAITKLGLVLRLSGIPRARPELGHWRVTYGA